MIKKRFRRAFSPSTYHKKKKKKTVRFPTVCHEYVSKIQNFKTVYKKYWGLSREEIVKKKTDLRDLYF